MKKSVSLILVLLLLLGSFTACDITTNFSDAVSGEADATPKVEEMITALAENNLSDAKDLMHPQVAEDSDEDIARLSEYIDGRDAESIEVTGISINTTTGTGGKVREEQVSYEVTLTDGEVVSLNVVYLSNNEGEGFSVFQIVL